MKPQPGVPSSCRSPGGRATPPLRLPRTGAESGPAGSQSLRNRRLALQCFCLESWDPFASSTQENWKPSDPSDALADLHLGCS